MPLSFMRRLERPAELLEVRLGRFPARLDERGDPEILLGLHVAEGEVLELGLDPAHPEPVGDRGVDLEGLRGDLFLLVFGEELERLEVVEPVGQLDEDDPEVVGHGQDDLADGLGPAGLGRGFLDAADLGHALDEAGDVLAEGFLEFGRRDVGVLQDVVEKPGDEGRPVEVHVGEMVRDLERMAEIGFPERRTWPLWAFAEKT